jgi:predicted ABC-type transport system involved in lysophospholipase L1 biosynthesis ATPase subunit
VAGLMDRPSAGEISLNGSIVSPDDEAKRARLRLDTIGFLFQFHYLLPDFSVLENTLLPVRLAKTDLAQGEDRARRLLGRLGLEARLNHWPHQLSGGEQQRAALARAMIRNPRLLLCDEPTGNLDGKTAGEMIRLLWETAREEKTAVVLVTHNEELARQVDTSYHLVDGKLERGK